MSETYKEKTARVSKNGWTRLTGFSRKSSYNLQARMKKAQLDRKKKAFGLELMNKVLQEETSSPGANIQSLIANKRTELLKEQRQIEFLKAQAADAQKQTREQLIRHPSKRVGGVTQPSVTVN